MTAFDASLDPQRMEAPLSDREQAVRDYFVNEYMRDFDPYRACIRMGFLANFAIDMSKQFMADGYVLRKIAFLTRSATLDPVADKAEMEANVRWLAFNGSGAVRATASKQYMEAKGYIQKDSGGAEAVADRLIAALSDFADNAPS